MKAATAGAHGWRFSGSAQSDAAQHWRLIGLSIAVGVPVMFWTAALVLLGGALGVSISPIGAMAAAAAVGLSCAFGASSVMGERPSRS